MQPYHAGADLDALPFLALCGRARAPRRIRHRTAGRAATSGNATAGRRGISFRSGVGHGTSAQVRAATSGPDAKRISSRSGLTQRVMIPNRKLNHRVAGIGFALCVILMCLTSTSAATLAEYRRRVSDGVVAVQQLQLAHANANSLREQSRQTAVARLRTLLPAKETVLLAGQTIAVDNSWLHEALDQYEKSLGSHGGSNEVLARIGERLLALGQRMDEIQNGTKALRALSKDEEKGRLAEILRRPEYQKEAAEGSAIGRLWDRFMRWLASLFPKTKPIQRGSSRLISGIAQIVVILVALALIGFLIWKFVPRYLRNRTRKKPKREARIVLGERLEPDQTAADLLAQAEGLSRDGALPP